MNLVAIPSVAGDTKALNAAVDYIAALLSGHPNITIERFESNNVPSLLAYYGPVRPARFDTILNAHVDCVPGKPEQFIPRLEGNRLYGRGVYDMKAAAIIMTDVFLQHQPEARRPIGLQIVADEEMGGQNGVKYQVEQGVATDFAIFGEMTDLDICNETRGICWIEVEFKGVSAHGGYAWNGDNAITKASNFANAVLAKFPVPKAQQWCTTANIASITTGNTAYNIVPDAATVRIDFRFTAEDLNFISRQSVCNLIAQIDPEAVIVDMPFLEAAVHVPPEDPYLKHLAHIYERHAKRSVGFIRRYGSGDSRFYAVHGTPCVEFGLAGDHLHADNEYIELEGTTVYRSTLQEFIEDSVPLNTPALENVELTTVS